MTERPVALITGAARGIGAVTARLFVENGYDVAVTFRSSAEAARTLCERLSEDEATAVPLAIDLAVPDAAEQLIAEVRSRFRRLDVLINNAATVEGAAFSSSASDFDRQFAVNVRAPFLLCRAALEMLEASANASIVNVSSLNGSRKPSFGAPLDSASKAALEQLTVSLAPEMATHGIRINAVAPGATETEAFLGGADEAVRDHFRQRAAMGRLGRPEEVARVIAFLASTQAGWITGEVISASGRTR